MAREKEGYRDLLARLGELYPERAALTRKEVAAALGVSYRTVQRRVKWPAKLPTIPVTELARQMCG